MIGNLFAQRRHAGSFHRNERTGRCQVAAAILAALMLQSCVAADDRSRPNILFAFADDWGRLASAYANAEDRGINDVVHTPNFDAIARRGVLFENAFVNAPSCTPCRSSLLSGQHFWRTGQGAILQGAVWDPEIPAWPLLLRDAGYTIGKSWKVWSPGVPRDAPFGGQQYALQMRGQQVNRFSQYLEKAEQQGRSIDRARRELLDTVRFNFEQLLDANDADSPFCYWFGPTNVHRKWVQGSGSRYWDIDPDDLEGKLPPFLPDVAEVRQDVADYLGEIAAFDASLGILIDVLRERGILDETLVIVSGDHGPPGFPHGKCNLYDFGTRVPLAIAGPHVVGGRQVTDLVSLPDLAPTILEAGNIAVPQVMTARSLWPTLRANKSGAVDPARSAVFIGRERHVARARAGWLPYPQRAIRTADFLFILNFRPDRYPLGDPYQLEEGQNPSFAELANNTFVTLPDEDAGPTKAWLVTHRNKPQVKPLFENAYGKRPRRELYDVCSDPHQMNNLAAKPEHAETVERLEMRLLAELERTGDPRLVDEGEYFETPPLAGPPSRNDR